MTHPKNAEPSTLQKHYSSGEHVEDHNSGSGEALKVVVFGGLDGIMTIFALVAGCAGTDVKPWQTVGLGLATLVASAFSMGFGEYVSTKAEVDYIASELKREQYELEHSPDLEKQEMYDIYTRRYNFASSKANELVDLTFSNKKFFLQHMMAEELGILVQEESLGPGKRGLIMFASHCIFGTLPLVGFFGFFIGKDSVAGSRIAFGVSSALSLLGTMALGYYKGLFTRQNKTKTALWMTFNGVVVGITSYAIGVGIAVSWRCWRRQIASAFIPELIRPLRAPRAP